MQRLRDYSSTKATKCVYVSVCVCTRALHLFGDASGDKSGAVYFTLNLQVPYRGEQRMVTATVSLPGRDSRSFSLSHDHNWATRSSREWATSRWKSVTISAAATLQHFEWS